MTGNGVTWAVYGSLPSVSATAAVIFLNMCKHAYCTQKFDCPSKRKCMSCRVLLVRTTVLHPLLLTSATRPTHASTPLYAQIGGHVLSMYGLNGHDQSGCCGDEYHIYGKMI